VRDIDKIFELLKRFCPAAEIRQLKVLHPGADDDGLWFITQPESSFEVQLESSNGMCPFVVETDETNQRWTAKSVDEAIEIVSVLLHLGRA
jgi:hypothetical protein